MTEFWKQHWRHKMLAPDSIESTAAEIKAKGQTIATLNGSFDILHAGHLHIIFEASKQADTLIMALNTDRSIQSYKSIHRPFVPLEERLEMVAALSFVTYVTWFDETDPRELLAKIKPDVHINGAEYGKDCIEAETVKQHGGQIHIVTLIPGLSTSQLIQKIKSTP